MITEAVSKDILAILKERRSKHKNERESLFEYLKYSFRQYKFENWHHHLICDYLQRWVLGDIDRLMIFAPPRHMKTEATERALTWAMGKLDDCMLMIAGYSDTKAKKISMHVRNNINDPKFAEVFPERIKETFMKGVNTQTFWELDNDLDNKSAAISAGVNGPITGEGFIRGYIDDPYKSRAEAESATTRESTITWFKETFLNRQNEDGAGILFTTTRWHKLDVNGQLLLEEGIKEYNGHKPTEGCPDWNEQNEGKWTVLNLVAIHDEESYQFKHPEDPRQIGDALWPQRFPVSFLQQFITNKYAWASNFMGSPSVRAGNLISRDWIHPIEKLPFDPIFIRFWDLAGTPKSTIKQNDPDYTAGVLVAYFEGKYIIVDVKAIRATPMEVDKLMETTARADAVRYGDKITQIWEEEGGAGGKHITDKYKKLLNFCKRRPYQVGKNKEFYIDQLANKAQTGDVLYIERAPWVHAKTDHGTFWDELEAFPKGAHDDRIDACAKAVHIIGEKEKINFADSLFLQSANMAI